MCIGQAPTEQLCGADVQPADRTVSCDMRGLCYRLGIATCTHIGRYTTCTMPTTAREASGGAVSATDNTVGCESAHPTRMQYLTPTLSVRELPPKAGRTRASLSPCTGCLAVLSFRTRSKSTWQSACTGGEEGRGVIRAHAVLQGPPVGAEGGQAQLLCSGGRPSCCAAGAGQAAVQRGQAKLLCSGGRPSCCAACGWGAAHTGPR
jgi:hypothetical protein